MKYLVSNLVQDRPATVLYLIHRGLTPLLSCSLGVGHNDDALRQPVVRRLFAPAFHSPNPQLSLQLLNESVLRVTFIYDDWSHFAPQQCLPEHWVHVRCLLGAADYRLQLESG